MTKFVVKNENEALEALAKYLRKGGVGVKIRFRDFVKTVESTGTIDEMQRSRFFIALQRSIQREHCRYKYGDTSLKRLTDDDRRVTKIASNTI